MNAEGALKAREYIEKLDVERMTMDDALALSKICTDMIGAAVMLNQKIISKLRAAKEKVARDAFERKSDDGTFE